MNASQRESLRKITGALLVQHFFACRRGTSTPEIRRKTKRCLEVIADTAAGQITFDAAMDMLKQIRTKDVQAYEGYTMF